MHAQVTEQTSPEVPPALARIERRPRILLVEDDPDMSRLVAAVLRNEHYDVVTVSSGVDMLRCIESAVWNDEPVYYDAIVSDIQMPDLSALEVLDAFRARCIETPVVLMTAYGNDQTSRDARALGAFALLDKPLDWEALRGAVRNAVRDRG